MVVDGVGKQLLRLRVSLVGSEPEIWRLVEVRGTLNLADLHSVIQISFAWDDAHLHRFEASDGRCWSDPRSVDVPEEELDESSATVAEVLIRDEETLSYIYDFGDEWEHRIELAGIASESPDGPAARLVDGAERGPWEDSGGWHGYAAKVAVLADPSHTDHEMVRDWVDRLPGPWVTPIDFGDAAIERANASLTYRFSPETVTAGWNPEFAAVVARMYAGPQAHFVAYVRSAGVGQTELNPPDDVAEIVRPYAWLLDQVGSEGLRLTQAGWLPPALVKAAMTELEWTDHWYGSFTREIDTRPVMVLRDSATRLGLIRKVKGTLQLAPAGRRLRSDPAGLWTHLAQRWFRAERAGIERDTAVVLASELAVGAHRTSGELFDGVAYGLGALGWADPSGYLSPTPEDAQWLVASVHDVLRTLGLKHELSPDPDAPVFTDQAQNFARYALAAPRGR